MTRRLKVPLIALGWVVAIVALGQFIEGHLYSSAVVRPHPLGIVVWLVFGALLAVPGRIATRAVVLTAGAALVAMGALGQLALPSHPFDAAPWYSSYLAWASSSFTWIAAGVLLTQGLWGLTARGSDVRSSASIRPRTRS